MLRATPPWASVSSTMRGWLPGQRRQALHGPVSAGATSCMHGMVTAKSHPLQHYASTSASNCPCQNAIGDSRHPSLQVAGARKVLILDWDVHHGELCKDFAKHELDPFLDCSVACLLNCCTSTVAPLTSHLSLQAMAHSTSLRMIQTSCTCRSIATTCELLHPTRWPDCIACSRCHNCSTDDPAVLCSPDRDCGPHCSSCCASCGIWRARSPCLPVGRVPHVAAYQDQPDPA